MGYKGDVTVDEVWKALKEDENAVLIDVRTQAEWAFVGICDLSEADKSPVFISWQNFPHMEVNPGFTDAVLSQAISKDSPLYFLCRSGVRSMSAASAISAMGYDKCFNILGGFEGDKNASGHRGLAGGWKASGLPWTQN